MVVYTIWLNRKDERKCERYQITGETREFPLWIHIQFGWKMREKTCGGGLEVKRLLCHHVSSYTVENTNILYSLNQTNP